VSAHLALKGLIDPVKELEKLNKKKTLLNQQIEKLTKLTQGSTYTQNISNVQYIVQIHSCIKLGS
jgi:hypothetical protein